MAVTEELKLPLLQIARLSELTAAKPTVADLRAIQETADLALQLLDSYLLSQQLPHQQALQLEPVSVSAVLQDTAHQLHTMARQYGCQLEVSLSGKYGPVMAHKPSLESAIMMLGYTFITSQFANDKHQLVLGAHRSPRGIVAGIFSEQKDLSSDMFRRARALYGTVRQPLAAVSPSAGAGVFVADSLMQGMDSQLHVARHDNLTGLAATLLQSRQLALV
jgi:hypothetical protein